MELEMFVLKVKLQFEMFWSEFCSGCDLTLLIIVVIFDRLSLFQRFMFVDAFLL
jgi:hypothetical protein